MKKIIGILIIATLLLFATACGDAGNKQMQGVKVDDLGNLKYVIFSVPSGSSIENVLGSKLGSSTSFSTTEWMTGRNLGLTEVYEVEKGGVLSCAGNICCYGPNASISFKGNPPVDMLTIPSENNEIFNPEDSEELFELYGIKLNFG